MSQCAHVSHAELKSYLLTDLPDTRGELGETFISLLNSYGVVQLTSAQILLWRPPRCNKSESFVLPLFFFSFLDTNFLTSSRQDKTRRRN